MMAKRNGPSLDHLVGASEHARWHFDAERLGCFEGEHLLGLRRRLYRRIGRLLTLQDAVDVAGGAPVLMDVIMPIGDKAAGVDEDTIVVDRRQLVAGRQLDDQIAMKPHPGAAARD